MANPFDQFDSVAVAPNPFDQFDAPALNPFDKFDEKIAPQTTRAAKEMSPQDIKFATTPLPSDGNLGGIKAPDRSFTQSLKDFGVGLEKPFWEQWSGAETPMPENTSIGTGIARAAIRNVGGLVSTENLGIAAGTSILPPPLQKAVSAGFGVQMGTTALQKGKEAVEAWKRGNHGEAAELGTEALFQGVLGTLGLYHGLSSSRISGGRPASLDQIKVDEAIKAAPAPVENHLINDQTLDGVVAARDKAVSAAREFPDNPRISSMAGEIQWQLKNVPPERIAQSRIRNEEQSIANHPITGQSETPATSTLPPETEATEGTPPGPSTEGGRASAFTQALREQSAPMTAEAIESSPPPAVEPPVAEADSVAEGAGAKPAMTQLGRALEGYFTGRAIQVTEGTLDRPLSNYLPPGSTLGKGMTIRDAVNSGELKISGGRLHQPGATNPAPEQKLRDAYQRVLNDPKNPYRGFPDVNISDVIRESGLPMDEAQKTITDLRGKGVQLGGGDFSLAGEDERAGAIDDPTGSASGKMMLIRFEDIPEDLTKGGDRVEKENAQKENEEKGLLKPEPAAVQPGEQASPDPQAAKMVEGLKKVGRVNRDPAASVAKELSYYSDEERTQLQQHLGTSDAEPDTLAQAITGKPKLKETSRPSDYVDEPGGKEGRGHPTADVAREAFGEDYTGGPGAMGPREAEAMKSEQATTGLKKATVLVERLARGDEPLAAADRQSETEAVSRAMETQDRDPMAARNLVARVLDQGDSAISRDEAALLLTERNRVQEDMRQADATLANETASPLERSEAQGKLKDLETQIDRLDRAQKEAGSQWGRVGRMYQRMIREDYSLEGIQRKMRTAKGGPLDETERAQAEEAAKKMDEASKTRDAAESAHAAEILNAEKSRMIEATINELGKAYLKSPSYGKQVWDIARNTVERWKKEAAGIDLDKEIGNFFGSESGGIGGVGGGKGGKKLGEVSAAKSEIIRKIALKLRADIGEFGVTKADAIAEYVNKHGEKVRDIATKAWDQAQKLIASEKISPDSKEVVKKGVSTPGEKKTTDVAARAKAEAAAGGELTSKTAYEAVRSVVNSGVRGEKEIGEAALNLLKPHFLDLTMNELDVKSTRYGQAKFPSQEEVKVVLAKQLRLRQMQAAIEDVKKRGETAKSGVQRAKADADVRQRQSELKAAIEQYGKEKPASPEQLANREAAAIRTKQNAIEDLNRELSTGEKKLAAAKKEQSPAVEQLQSELDAMQEFKKELEDAGKPQPTPEDIAADAAQRDFDSALVSRERWAQTLDRISTGELDVKSKEGKASLTQLAEDVRLETEGLKRAAAELKKEGMPVKPEAQKQLESLQRQRDTLRKIISGEIEPKKAKTFEALSTEAENVQAEIQAMRELQAERKREAAVKSPEDIAAVAAQKGVDRAVAALDRQQRINSGELKPEPNEKVQPLSALEKELRDRTEELRQTKRDAEKATPEQKTADAAQREVDRAAAALDRQERINSGEIKPDATEKKQPLTGLAKDLKDRTEELRKAKRDAERATPEESYNKRRMTQILKEEADLRERLRSGKLEKEKPLPLKKTATVAAAEAKLTETRREVDKAVERKKYEQLSPQQKFFKEALSTIRSITAIKILGHGSVGMVTHAGGLIFRPTRAAIYWKNFGRQFGMWNDKAYHEQLIYRLKNDPEFETWKKAGASIDPEKTYTDYGMYAQWLGKLGEKGARGFDALKLTRMEMNKADWAHVPDEIKADPKQADAARKLIAEINNKATGSTPKTNPVGKTLEEGFYGVAKNPILEAAFFAPRLYASRWGRVLFDPVKTARTLFDPASSPAEMFAAKTKLKNAAEFTGTLAAALLTNQAILSATGSKQNVNLTDPKKSDWLKFKAGGKTLTADGGLLDPVRLLGQVIWKDLLEDRTKQQQYREGSRFKMAVDTVGSYLRGKLNPPVGFAADVATGSDFQGRPLPWSKEKPQFKDQTPYTYGEWLLDQGPIPLEGTAKEVAADLKDKGFDGRQTEVILKAIASFGLGMAGVHVGEDYTTQPKQSSGATIRLKRR
jgi:hypothetical protein